MSGILSSIRDSFYKPASESIMPSATPETGDEGTRFLLQFITTTLNLYAHAGSLAPQSLKLRFLTCSFNCYCDASTAISAFTC